MTTTGAGASLPRAVERPTHDLQKEIQRAAEDFRLQVPYHRLVGVAYQPTSSKENENA